MLRPSKRDAIYQAAMSAMQSVMAFISLKNESGKDIKLDKSLFHKIFPNDPSSPSIYWLEDDQYVIYYPPNSKPYSHRFEDKCKFIECLSGKLFDANSDFKMFKGDTLKVTPKDNYAPYTMGESCYLRVCVGNCESLWDQVCK